MSKVCRDALQHNGIFLSDASYRGDLLIPLKLGTGCTKLRQEVVERKFADEATFESMMRELRRRFKNHAEGLRQKLEELASTHLGAMRATLDLVREENAAEESERDPEFRQRVAEEVARVRCVMGI